MEEIEARESSLGHRAFRVEVVWYPRDVMHQGLQQHVSWVRTNHLELAHVVVGAAFLRVDKHGAAAPSTSHSLIPGTRSRVS